MKKPLILISYSAASILIGLLLTYSLWIYVKEKEEQKVRSQIESLSKQNAHLLEKQINAYINNLQALQAFFNASTYVDNAEFNKFIQSLDVQKSHPGIKALGFSELISSQHKKGFIARLNEEGINNYQVFPSGNRSFYAPITYVYPTNKLNEQVLGFDTLSEPLRRSAIIKSASINKVSITNPLELLQDSLLKTNKAINKAESYVIYLPVKQSRSTYTTESSDFSNVNGWVYIAFNINELVNEVFNQQIENLEIAIYDGGNANARNLVYSNLSNIDSLNQSALKDLIRIQIDDKTWSFYSKPRNSAEQSAYSYKPIYILEIGLILSLLFGVLVWLLIERGFALNEIDKFHDALFEREKIWKLALDGAGDGVWDYDIETNKNKVSNKWTELLGFSQKELTEDLNEWLNRIHPDDFPTVMKTLEEYIAGNSKHYAIEHRLKCKDGSWKWILSRGMAVERDHLSRPTRMVGTITDISKMKASEALILEQANFDSLTGLPNRRAFFTRLSHEIKLYQRYQRGFALLFIDLDEFKEVNDELGHHAGDEVLKSISQQIKDNIRDTDMVARLGGDEFIILLSNIDQTESADELAQKILDVIITPIKVDDRLIKVSASIGISYCPTDGVVEDVLINKADKAMYAAKNMGKNCWARFNQAFEAIDSSKV